PPGKKQVADNDFIETIQAVSMDAVLAKLKVTVDNAASISGDLSGIMRNIHEGKGTIGKLFMDTVLAKTVDDAMMNIKQGTGGFKQNMTAASHNFLLKGYFKKKKRENEKKGK
ncbi:MAG: MlaD family protein, partial [Bacteroidia bacterium]